MPDKTDGWSWTWVLSSFGHCGFHPQACLFIAKNDLMQMYLETEKDISLCGPLFKSHKISQIVFSMLPNMLHWLECYYFSVSTSDWQQKGDGCNQFSLMKIQPPELWHSPFLSPVQKEANEEKRQSAASLKNFSNGYPSILRFIFCLSPYSTNTPQRRQVLPVHILGYPVERRKDTLQNLKSIPRWFWDS